MLPIQTIANVAASSAEKTPASNDDPLVSAEIVTRKISAPDNTAVVPPNMTCTRTAHGTRRCGVAAWRGISGRYGLESMGSYEARFCFDFASSSSAKKRVEVS